MNENVCWNCFKMWYFRAFVLDLPSLWLADIQETGPKVMYQIKGRKCKSYYGIYRLGGKLDSKF